MNRARVLLLLVLTLGVAACGDGTTVPDDGATGPGEPIVDGSPDAEGPLTVYSGRSEELVGPLFERFTADTGIEVEVRYGDTAELAATILEEGANSPADVYFGQDAGALGALRAEGVLRELPDALLDLVEGRFRAQDGSWVGVSGRSRVIVHHTDALSAEEVPDSVLDLTHERWSGRIAWAPTNGSFQAFVTAMRVELGDEETAAWLKAMIDNGVQAYEKNTAIVEAVGRGEVDLGLVNHYYLYQFLAEDPELPADNAFLDGGDVGSLVNVAGAGILGTTDQPTAAERLVEYLLSDDAQRYFAEETYEYPLVTGIPADERLPALETIETPELDLSDLDDLEGTLRLLRETGALG